jgi:hypothetical protein
MSTYSTLYITREDCLAEIIKRILKADDIKLEHMLFTMTEDENLFNYRIVKDYEGLDEDCCVYEDFGL